MNCKNCGAPISEQHFVREYNMFRCGHCDAFFAAPAAAPSAASGKPATQAREKVTLPKGFDIEDLGSRLKLKRKWPLGPAIGMLIFALLWNGVIVGTFVVGAGSDGGPNAFILIFVAVGLFVLFRSIVYFVNSTTIIAGDGKVKVSHGPIPAKFGKTLAVDQIDQLVSREVRRRTSNDKGRTTSVQYSYKVQAIRKDRQRVDLVVNLKTADEALYIEQELERHLGIKDEKVSGELRR